MTVYSHTQTATGARVTFDGAVVSSRTVAQELRALRAALQTARILIECPRLDSAPALKRIEAVLR